MTQAFLATVLLALVARSVGRSDYSYSSKGDCVPGYDQDCTTPMAITGSSIAKAVSPQPADHLTGNSKDEHELEIPAKTRESSSSSKEEECKLDIPKDCKFPFTYKGHQYTTCTAKDVLGTKWCSVHNDYRGSWRECKNTCKHTLPLKSLIGTAVTGAAVVAGAGIAAGVTEMMHHEKAESVGAMEDSKPIATSVFSDTPSPDVSGNGVTPAVQVASAPSSGPWVTARFLNKQNHNVVPVAAYVEPQAVTPSPTQHSWLSGLPLAISVAAAVCCCVCICGIVAAGFAFRKKRAQMAEPESESDSEPEE